MSLREELADDPARIASIIEHTNVDPTATEADVRKLCRAVLEYGFHAAVVVPYHAKLADELLGERAAVTAVIGFPYGIQNADAKQSEASALLEYVDEFDVVMNRTAFANGDYDLVVEEVEAVKAVVGDNPLKCIIESPVLSRSESSRAAKLVEDGGADFVKTAVGYDGPTDSTEVEAIRAGIDSTTGVKASGGIRSFGGALEMVAAGATRIGTSSGIEIYESAR